MAKKPPLGEATVATLVAKVTERDLIKSRYRQAIVKAERAQTSVEDDPAVVKLVRALHELDIDIRHLQGLLDIQGEDLSVSQLNLLMLKQKRKLATEEKLHPRYAPPAPVPVPERPSTSISEQDRLWHDFEYFCLKCIKIPYRPGMLPSHPAGGYGPLILTTAQKMVVAVLVRLLLIERVPVRLVILKSRQLGCTTLLLAFWTWLMVTHDHYHVMFMIDKDAHGRTKRDELIRWLNELSQQYEFFPTIAQRDQKFVRLSNGSLFMFESAEAPNPGTSEMLHGLHESEKPKWPHGRAQQVEASIGPSLPSAPMTLHVDESTAMGIDDFSAKWDLANDPTAQKTDIQWTPIFLPWYVSPEYATATPADFTFINDDDELKDLDQREDGDEVLLTEQLYALKYNLTKEQVYWRRTKIKVTFKGNRATFDQEYPTTAKHAWRATQQSFFPRRMLERASTTLHEPILYQLKDLHGYTNHNQEVLYSRLQPAPILSSQGDIQVWEKPIPGARYYAGIDVAEGKTSTTAQGELEQDWTRCSIKDAAGRTVAHWKTRERVETLWLPLLLLLLWYNRAFLNGERNAIGLVLLVALVRTGYPNMLLNMEPKGRPVEDRLWTTVNKGNRETMLTALRASYNAPFCEIWSAELLRELQAFIRRMSGGTTRLEAKAGSHDDFIFAEMHAEVMRAQFPQMRAAAPDPTPAPVVAPPVGYHWTLEEIAYFEDDT